MLKLKLQYTLSTCCEELTHLKKHWCWEKLRMGREGDDRGWGGWRASPTWWTWVWASSGGWWWTGKPGVLQSMGSQGQTQLSNWTELNNILSLTLTKIYSSLNNIHNHSDDSICWNFNLVWNGLISEVNKKNGETVVINLNSWSCIHRQSKRI